MNQRPVPDRRVEPPNLALTLARSVLDVVLVFLATGLVLVAIFLSVGMIVPMVGLSPLVFLALAVAIPIGGIYRHVLLRVYLKRKLTPMFAGAAVALCTAMVIIVISVMGGFLQMMRDSARKLTGEVTVRSDLTGFEHYEDLIVELVKESQITAATPLLRVPGLLDLGGFVQVIPEVVGIVPTEYDAVCGFSKTLHWTLEDDRGYEYDKELITRAPTLTPFGENGELPGMIPGIEIWQDNRRDENGDYDFSWCSIGQRATLTLFPLSKKGTLAYEPQAKEFVVFNEFKSGLYEVDKNRLFVPFDVLQRMLRIEARRVQVRDNKTGELTGEIKNVPGRTIEVAIGGAAGVSTAELAAASQRAVGRFQDARENPPLLVVETWAERHATLLSAVEKEKGLLTVLFAFISVVAVVLVAVIFYMIVAGKTRDIGTLRALGASRMGVATIFMGYGLAIGVIGAALGAALAAVIVRNLNGIQDLLYQWFEFKMWDPRIYYFDRIPTQMDGLEVLAIVTAAVLSSLLGAVVPALLAARANPVDALRYE